MRVLGGIVGLLFLFAILRDAFETIILPAPRQPEVPVHDRVLPRRHGDRGVLSRPACPADSARIPSPGSDRFRCWCCLPSGRSSIVIAFGMLHWAVGLGAQDGRRRTRVSRRSLPQRYDLLHARHGRRGAARAVRQAAHCLRSGARLRVSRHHHRLPARDLPGVLAARDRHLAARCPRRVPAVGGRALVAVSHRPRPATTSPGCSGNGSTGRRRCSRVISRIRCWRTSAPSTAISRGWRRSPPCSTPARWSWSGFDGWCVRQAQLTFAMARHAVVDLAQVFSTRQPAGPVDRLTDAQFDQLITRLQAAGMHFEDGDAARAAR